MLVDENKRFLISSFCSSTSNCTLQHCYLCPWRLVANHLYREMFLKGHEDLHQQLIAHQANVDFRVPLYVNFVWSLVEIQIFPYA